MESRVKFGTFFFFQLPPGRSPEEVIHNELDQMDWTEELGFDQIWITEHHFIEYGLSVDPPAIAAAAAMRTRRVRIGLAAAILPFHNPIRLAEQLALVDIMSRGRLDVGIGRGNRPMEFHGYQIPQVESRARYEEMRQILTGLWTQEHFGFEGKHYRIPRVRMIPKPYQKPHPPLYVVCVGPDTIKETARLGLPMLNSVLYGDISPLAANRDLYVKTMRESGFDEAHIAAALGKWGVSRHVYVAPSDQQAFAEAKEAEMWYQSALKRFLVPDRIEDAHPDLQPAFRAMAERLDKITWEDLARETLVFGAPDTVAAKMEDMRKLGVGQALCWMNFGGLPQDKVRRSMELFSKEVMPRFR
jgi:alkanesulfonate monooxygenase SsuD/methylene tetrahydromethanopterin reductase-like flavin-dependent oxidoreductase (luciferase family)